MLQLFSLCSKNNEIINNREKLNAMNEGDVATQIIQSGITNVRLIDLLLSESLRLAGKIINKIDVIDLIFDQLTNKHKEILKPSFTLLAQNFQSYLAN